MLTINKFRQSIFLKILLVFAIAAILHVIVLRTFQHNFMYNDEKRLRRAQNMAEYGNLLSHSLGENPNAETIKALTSRLPLRVRFEAPGIKINSDPEVPDFESVRAHGDLRFSDANSRVTRFEDYLAVEATLRPGVHYLFLIQSESAIDAHSEIVLIPVAILLVILILCYFAIRFILSPLKQIEDGVQAVARGHLDYQIQTEGADELSRLARSFNTMTNRVRLMLQSKEQLLLDVSHELRSPLTRIRLAMEIPGEEARSSAKQALLELDSMLTELLESARLNDDRGRLKLEKIDLVQMLRELSDLYEDQKPGLKLVLENDSLLCYVDPTRMQITLRNLLENALKYSKEQSRPVELALRTRAPGLAVITIKDYGIGISKEEQAFVFEPFYRVDHARLKSTGGYGLGLAICQKIMALHRGQIYVESTLGQGSLFTLELPMGV